MIRSSKYASLFLAVMAVVAVAERVDAQQQGPAANSIAITDPVGPSPAEPGRVPPIPTTGDFVVKGDYDSKMDPNTGGIGIIVQVMKIVNGQEVPIAGVVGETSAKLGTAGGKWTVTVKNPGGMTTGETYFLKASLKDKNNMAVANAGFAVEAQ